MKSQGPPTTEGTRPETGNFTELPTKQTSRNMLGKLGKVLPILPGTADKTADTRQTTRRNSRLDKALGYNAGRSRVFNLPRTRTTWWPGGEQDGQ